MQAYGIQGHNENGSGPLWKVDVKTQHQPVRRTAPRGGTWPTGQQVRGTNTTASNQGRNLKCYGGQANNVPEASGMGLGTVGNGGHARALGHNRPSAPPTETTKNQASSRGHICPLSKRNQKHWFHVFLNMIPWIHFQTTLLSNVPIAWTWPGRGPFVTLLVTKLNSVPAVMVKTWGPHPGLALTEAKFLLKNGIENYGRVKMFLRSAVAVSFTVKYVTMKHRSIYVLGNSHNASCSKSCGRKTKANDRNTHGHGKGWTENLRCD